MDADRLDLIRRLFVLATEIAEDVHDAAVAGQGTSSRSEALAAAEDLRLHAHELVDVARAIGIAAGAGAAGETSDDGR